MGEGGCRKEPGPGEGKERGRGRGERVGAQREVPRAGLGWVGGGVRDRGRNVGLV